MLIAINVIAGDGDDCFKPGAFLLACRLRNRLKAAIDVAEALNAPLGFSREIDCTPELPSQVNYDLCRPQALQAASRAASKSHIRARYGTLRARVSTDAIDCQIQQNECRLPLGGGFYRANGPQTNCTASDEHSFAFPESFVHWHQQIAEEEVGLLNCPSWPGRFEVVSVSRKRSRRAASSSAADRRGFLPSPIAASRRYGYLSPERRKPCGSMEAAWSLPHMARSRVMCLSMNDAPKATAATVVARPTSVAGDTRSGVVLCSQESVIICRFNSSLGQG